MFTVNIRFALRPFAPGLDKGDAYKDPWDRIIDQKRYFVERPSSSAENKVEHASDKMTITIHTAYAFL